MYWGLIIEPICYQVKVLNVCLVKNNAKLNLFSFISDFQTKDQRVLYISQGAILSAAKTATEERNNICSQAEAVGQNPMTLCWYNTEIKESGYENTKVDCDNKQEVFTSDQKAVQYSLCTTTCCGRQQQYAVGDKMFVFCTEGAAPKEIKKTI